MATDIGIRYSWNSRSPMDDPEPRDWNEGDIRFNTDGSSPIIQWICTDRGRPGIWAARYGGFGGDSIPRVANIAALAAIVTTSYSTTQAHLAEVLSVGDFFKYDPLVTIAAWSNVTAYVVGNLVTFGGATFVAVAAGTNHATTDRNFWFPSMSKVSSNDGLGTWVRLGIQSFAWQHQTTWSIDESNSTGLASDENTGLTDGAPLYTIAEFIRRTGPEWTLASIVTVRWLSNATALLVDFSYITSNDPTTVAAYLAFVGIPVVVQSGTLTAGTAAPGGNVAPIVEDTAIASTWTAAGGISTSTGGRMIRRTSGNVRAWISKELGSKQARISAASNTQEVVTNQTPAAASFSSGDGYEVVRLTTFPGVKYTAQTFPRAIRFLLLHVSGGSITQLRVTQAQFVLCSFGGVSSYNSALDLTCHCCCFMGGVTGVGIFLSRFGLFGVGATFVNSCPDWNGFTNTFQNGPVLANHASQVRMGNMFVFDTATDALQVNNNASAFVDAISGSGNSAFIMNVRDPGCWIGGSFASFQATTSAAQPLSVCSVPFDYADLTSNSSTGIWLLNKAAGFPG